jgi:hypothetical protein
MAEVATEIMAADRQSLERGVIGARWDIAHGRDPAPEHWEAACDGFTDAFGPLLDPLSEAAKDSVCERAAKFGLTDTATGEFDAEMMDLVMQYVERAFWLGLTQGHVIAGGEVYMPRRLFGGWDS